MTALADLLGVGKKQQAESKRDIKRLRGPMKYIGSKYDSLPFLLPLLPYRDVYIEPFGGSGCVLLNRMPSKLEVYNDRYSGLCCAFRVIKSDPDGLEQRLEDMLHSREEWEYCKQTWQNTNISDLERAARFIYMMQYSFVGKGQSFARVTSPKARISGSLDSRIRTFKEISKRLHTVQIENQDWRQCINDYDQYNAVIYLDPPYYAEDQSAYRWRLKEEDHIELLAMIFNGKGVFALSGYANDLYDSQKWTARYTWDRRDRVNAQAISGNNNRTTPGDRELKEEVLWIYDATKSKK